MIYVHSLGRAVRYYGEQTALFIGGKRLTFSELDNRVERIAAALSRRGLRTGDRLAVLLPNGPRIHRIGVRLQPPRGDSGSPKCSILIQRNRPSP